MASIAQKVIAFVYFSLIANFFSPEDTGSYFIALAIVTVLMVLDDVGLTSVIIREVAKKTDEAVLWSRTVIGVKLVTMPLTAIVALLVPTLLGYGPDVSQLVYIAIIVMLADTLSLSFYGILRGLQILKFESIGIFVGQIITTGIGISLLVTDNATLPLLVIALASGSVWNLLFSAHFIRKKLGWKAFVPTWQLGWEPLKIAYAFFLAAAFVKIYSYTDTIVLSKVLGNSAAGVYAVAFKLTYAFQFLPLAFVGALYPLMSTQAHESEKIKKTLLDAFWYMSILVAPIVFGIWSIAPEVVKAFYPSEYSDASITLMILIFVLIPIFLDFPLGSLLNATGKQKTKMVITGITTVLNIILNLVLIHEIGIPGAAVAAVTSATFMLFADWYFVRKIADISVSELFFRIAPIFGVAIVMAATVFFVKIFVAFYIAIPIGAAVYVLGLLTTKTVSQKHLKKIRIFFEKKTT